MQIWSRNEKKMTGVYRRIDTAATRLNARQVLRHSSAEGQPGSQKTRRVIVGEPAARNQFAGMSLQGLAQRRLADRCGALRGSPFTENSVKHVMQ